MTNNPGPNVTPLIDVLLVLLIICMVSTPKRAKGLPANVPEPSENAAPARQRADETAIVVQVSQTGTVLLNTQPLELAALGNRLQEVFARRADKTLFVSGDKDAEFHHVARVIDIARGAGIDRIALYK